jgi:hypothetical protein
MSELLKVDADTIINPRLSEILLITSCDDPQNRRIWVSTQAQPDKPIEVERQYHKDLLHSMNVDCAGFWPATL